MKYPVIFNPNAKGQRGKKTLQFFQDHVNSLTVYPTRHENEAKELAAKFAADGAKVVIAAGGDGTLNGVADGLAGSGTPLGVIPSGTMNVFARELGIPCDNLAECLQIIDRGESTEIDLFEANGLPFLQMAGMGLDARVIEQTSWLAKNRWGPLAYFLSAVRVLGERPPIMEVICGDGRREQGVFVLAGNGALYGGPFKLFRAADNQDSKLDVLVFKEAGYRLLLDSLKGMAMGGLDLATSIRYFQADSFSVRAECEIPVEVDGDLRGRFSSVDFSRSHRQLRVMAEPKKSAGSCSAPISGPGVSPGWQLSEAILGPQLKG